MSNLVNRHWINFDGEPVTGRTPPSILVYGPPMTPQQFGEVAHTYKLFTDANLVAVGDYQIRNRVLRDGTRVRCLSINGVDTVYVWTSGGEENVPVLFEGFVFIPYEPLAFTNYSNPSEPTHRVWGSPFNEGNPFGTPHEVNAFSAVAIVPSQLGGSAQSILMPIEKKGVEGEYEWEHYRWPSFKRPMRDIVRAGNLDWKGPPIKGLSDYPVISWYGPVARGLNYSYWVDGGFNSHINTGPLATSLFRNEVYFRGAVIAKTPYLVQGAALRVFDEKLWLVAITFHFESIGQEDYLNVHEHLYIKQVRLYDVEPMIDYHAGGKDQNDQGLYDPETKPYGWKLLAQRTYQATYKVGSGMIGVTEAPFHGYFFNQSGTEASAAVLQGTTYLSTPDLSFSGYPGRTVYRKQTWSVTNEGYGSSASYSNGPYRSDLVSIDYDVDRLVEATVSWVYEYNPDLGRDILTHADFYMDGAFIERFDAQNAYVGYLDLRYSIVVYATGFGSLRPVFFKRGGSVAPVGDCYVSVDVPFLSARPSGFFGGLFGYLPQIQCAVYKDFCLFSVSRMYDADLDTDASGGGRYVYFSEGDLLEYLGENPLPENYALDALRII